MKCILPVEMVETQSCLLVKSILLTIEHYCYIVSIESMVLIHFEIKNVTLVYHRQNSADFQYK